MGLSDADPLCRRRLNNMLLKKQLVNEEIKEEIQKYLETNENRNKHTKTYEMQQKHF